MSEMYESTKEELVEFLNSIGMKMAIYEMESLVSVMEILKPELKGSKYDIFYNALGDVVNTCGIVDDAISLVSAAIRYNEADTEKEKDDAYVSALEATMSIASGATGFSLMTSYFSYMFDIGAQCLASGYKIVSKYKQRLLMLEELMNEGIKKKDITELAEGDEDLKELAQLSKDLKELARFSELLECNSDSQGVNDVFDKLKLWVDADGDGVSVTGELKTLKEMGIKAIHLNYNNLLA